MYQNCLHLIANFCTLKNGRVTRVRHDEICKRSLVKSLKIYRALSVLKGEGKGVQIQIFQKQSQMEEREGERVYGRFKV